jgi:hypothetical protein
MTNIIPNTQKLFLAPNPALVKETFSFMGRRYFLLSDMALISEPNKHSFCPPADRGFYLKLPIKDFKEAKKRYENNRIKFLKAVGYLNEGGEKTQLTLF